MNNYYLYKSVCIESCFLWLFMKNITSQNAKDANKVIKKCGTGDISFSIETKCARKFQNNALW